MGPRMPIHPRCGDGPSLSPAPVTRELPVRRANVSRDELGTEVLSCATRIYSQNMSLSARIVVVAFFGTSLMVMPYCLMPLQALRNRNEVSESGPQTS